MADKKISQLTAATTPLAGTEVLPIVQSSTTKKATVLDVTGGVPINKGLGNTANTIAIGSGALDSTTTADGSVGIGGEALTASTTAGLNTAVGYRAFRAYTSSEACAFGYNAGISATGTRNHLFGFASGFNITSGSSNSCYGHEVAYYLTTGSNNSFFGYGSGRSTTGARLTGSNNNGFGYLSLYTLSTGAQNTAIGHEAGKVVTSGSNNTFIGGSAGNTATTGSNNGFFGYNAQPSAVDVSNEYTYGDANVTKHRFPGGDIVIGTAGKGIDFSANTNAAGMTSELLNDYEEGTWTPAALGGVITFSSALGKYTKIGNTVYLFGKVAFPATGDGNPAILVGLPFAPTDSELALSFGTVGYTDYSATTLLAYTTSLSRVYFSSPTGLLSNANLSLKSIYFGAAYTV